MHPRGLCIATSMLLIDCSCRAVGVLCPGTAVTLWGVVVLVTAQKLRSAHCWQHMPCVCAHTIWQPPA